MLKSGGLFFGGIMRKEFAKPAKNYEDLILSLQSKDLIIADKEYAENVLKNLTTTV